MSDKDEQASGRPIEAAGGVLWRPAVGGDELEVALVHRPKYDDWSLPKGKLNPGEHPVLGAVREVQEETGIRGTPGRPLGETHYVKDGTPKRVRYWAMRASGEQFAANDEVDQLMWLPPRQAQHHLDADRDRAMLNGVSRDCVDSQPLLLVRHGSAGERSTWTGDDGNRPLDERGVAQAQALVALLSAYAPTRIAAADVARCRETVAPLASALGLEVAEDKALSEAGYAADAVTAVDSLVGLLDDEALPAVLCSQGRAIPGLLAGLLARTASTTMYAGVRKGGLAIVHVTRSDAGPRVRAVECVEPLA